MNLRNLTTIGLGRWCFFPALWVWSTTIISPTLSSDSVQVSCDDSTIQSTTMLIHFDSPSRKSDFSIIVIMDSHTELVSSLNDLQITVVIFPFSCLKSLSWPWENCTVLQVLDLSGQVVHYFISWFQYLDKTLNYFIVVVTTACGTIFVSLKDPSPVIEINYCPQWYSPRLWSL